MRRWATRLGLAMVLGAARAETAPTPPGSAAPAPSSGARATDQPPSSGTTCVEHVPEGKKRPELEESIAPNGISGHAQLLKVVVHHGPGESVLPGGFSVESGSTEAKGLEAAGFYLPDPHGARPPIIERADAKDQATTTVSLFFVPLPDNPGRNHLVLPPLPITMARASGEVLTLCTEPHPIIIEDPIANDPHPQPKQNPPPRRQLEEWTTAKHITYAVLAALLVGALAAWLIGRFLRRPRPEAPPPPPRPPWEVALEALFDLRHSGLLSQGLFADFFDRVSDVVRRYLGDRYGYDGLESTTREAIGALREQALSLELFGVVRAFLQDADLVKFARRTPSEEECRRALEQAESIVTKTRPEPSAPPPTPEAPAEQESP